MPISIVEMGAEEKMAPEDQHGGYSHHTSHSTSSDLIASQYTSWTDSMAILTGVEAREQVLVSTSLSTTLHFPPRSGCLHIFFAETWSTTPWPIEASKALIEPAHSVYQSCYRVLAEHVMLCGCA